MSGGMVDAVRGCLKEEMRMDVISNNLANATVLGFKRDKISFQEILGESRIGKKGAKGRSLEPLDNAFVRIKADHAQGDTRITGNTLDFAISGKGFFKIDTPDGIRYTRRGNFSLDGAGYLITQDGFRVLGSGGPITISGNEIDVDGRGVIRVDGSQSGQIEVVDFENYDGLVKAGNALFHNASASPEIAPPPETAIQQGFVELSNVNMVEEMVQMIHCLRAFESYQKSIQVLDGLNSRAVNEVSRLR
jgi:flagellar basal-body rod protein FlgF